MTVAEEKLIEIVREIIKEYDDDRDGMYSVIEKGRTLIEVLTGSRP